MPIRYLLHLNFRILPFDYQLIPTDHRCSDRPTYGLVSHRTPERSSERSCSFFPPYSYLHYARVWSWLWIHACIHQLRCYIKRLTQTTLRAMPTPKLMPNSFINVYVNINSIGIQYDHHLDGRCLHVATRTPSVAKNLKHAVPPLALCTCAVFKWVQVQLLCWPAENHYLIVLLRPSRTIWRLSS